MRLLNAPEVPGVTAWWLVVTPPIVMLLAGIAVAGKPCPEITTDDGDVPMKLKVVVVLPTELENETHGLIVYVVDAVRAEVPPVAVTVFAPLVVSATAATPGVQVAVPALVPETSLLAPHEIAEDPPVRVEPVVHVKLVVVKAVLVTVTVSAEPNPVTAIVPETASSGKPKLLPANVIETLGVTVNAVLTVFVPSDTTIV